MMNQSPSSQASSSTQASTTSTLTGYRLNLEGQQQNDNASMGKPILPTMEVYHEQPSLDYYEDDDEEDIGIEFDDDVGDSPGTKRREWLLRMNRKLEDIPIGEFDPATIPISAIMNSWAKTKSANGAANVEMWLNRAQQEYDAGNPKVVPTTKMYTMAVDAWAKSGEGGSAAQRAEAILQHMHKLYQKTAEESLRPTTGIFNAGMPNITTVCELLFVLMLFSSHDKYFLVINAWARSKEKIAPARAEQILQWMEKLHETVDTSIQPDKYTFNTGTSFYFFDYS
jgi:hypothetical protein